MKRREDPHFASHRADAKPIQVRPQKRANARECEAHVLAYEFAGKVGWALRTGETETEFSNKPRVRRNRPTTRASKARNPGPKSVAEVGPCHFFRN